MSGRFRVVRAHLARLEELGIRAEDVKPMLACAQCGVHLPRDEALPGRGGVFCGEAHRSDYERAHPER